MERFHVKNDKGEDFDIVYWDNEDDIEPIAAYPKYVKPPFIARYPFYDETDTRTFEASPRRNLKGAYIAEYRFEEENSNGRSVAVLWGECKYSAYGGMCPGDAFDQYIKEHPEEPVTNLQIESERLSLDIEFYSFFDAPPGEGFAEHAHYIDGNEIVYEDTDYCRVEYDPDNDGPFEEFRENMDLPDDITEDMFDEDGIYTSGGYEVRFAIDGDAE